MTNAAPRRKKLPWIVASFLILGGVGGSLIVFAARREADPIALGTIAYGRKDYAHAQELARGRLKVAPADVEALRLMARATARLGREAAANAMFARLGSSSLQAEDLLLLGIGLDHAGNKASADAVWKKAAALQPDHAETLERLMASDLAQSRIGDAAQRAEQLSKLPGWELRGELELGNLRAELNDPAGASQALQHALERAEAAKLDSLTLTRYRKILARSLLKIGKGGEGATVLSDVLRNGPDAEASWLLSRAALQQGSISEFRNALAHSGSYRAEHPLESEPAPYVGAARCTVCHDEQAHTLARSRHSTTLLRGAELEKLPYPKGRIADPDNPSVTHEFANQAGKILAETRVKEDVLKAVVNYAFGAPDRYVSLVGDDAGGQPFVLRMSYYESDGESGWVRTTGHTAVDADKASHYLGKPIDRVNGLHTCLFCHTTDPKAVLDGVGPVAQDHAIGCERCHGPGSLHLKAIDAKLDDLAIVNPAKGSADGRIRVCGQCHGNHEETPVPRDDPHWLRFQSTTLPWSRCYLESSGALDCSSCHNPHGDPKLTKAQQDGHCLKCHSDTPVPARAAGTNAAGTAERSVRASICKVNATTGCVECHMPSTRIDAIRARFTDHHIRIHPDKPAANSK